MKKDLDSVQVVLFCRGAGSARLHERLGGVEAQRAVDRCLRRMDRSVDAFGGQLLKVIGNELKAGFSTADAAFLAAVYMKQRWQICHLLQVDAGNPCWFLIWPCQYCCSRDRR